MLVTKVVIPKEKFSIKCPYSMKPEGATIHNTANDASAMSEVSYMIKNNKQVSFHEAIDDYRVVQGIEHNRNAWHAGDGCGFGNMKTIGIEICYSKLGGERFEKAERNAAERLAYLMKEYGWTLDNITDKRHSIGTHKDRSGKNCPHRTIANGLERFYDMVREEYKELTGQVATGTPKIVVDETKNTTKRKVGDEVKINGVYASSTSTKRLNPSDKTGRITRIISGARNPYLLDNGNLGWVNDGCIVAVEETEVKNTSSTAPKIAVGSIVVLSSSATNYATGQKIPSCYKNRKYTIKQVNGTKVLLKELYSWVYTKDLVGYVSSATKTATTKTKKVNALLGVVIRKTPTTKAAKLGKVPNKKTVTVIKENYTTANGYKWDKIKYNNITGYCANKYLK